MADNSIIRKNSTWTEPVNVEAAAAVTPGHLVEHDSNNELAVHGTAAGAASAFFADLPIDPSKTKEDDYVAGEEARAFYALAGVEVEAIIGSGENVSAGDYLVSNGDGTLAGFNGAGGDEHGAVVAQAVEATDASGGDTRGVVRVV